MKSTPRIGYQQLLDTGLTVRQAYYWLRMGYIRPLNPNPGSGRRQEYTAAEIRVVRLAVRLVQVGFTVAAAFDIARSGRRDLGLGVHVVLDAETPPVYQQLVAERFAGRAQAVHNTVDGEAA